MTITHTPADGPVPVVVGLVDSPTGGSMVLVQLPDGFVLTSAAGARAVAASLLDTADELDGGARVAADRPVARLLAAIGVLVGQDCRARFGDEVGDYVDESVREHLAAAGHPFGRHPD